MKKGVLLAIGLAVVAFVSLTIWSAFRVAARTDIHTQGAALTPPRLSGYKIVQTMTGTEALAAIEHLHGKSIKMTDGYYVVYRSTGTGSNLLIWVASSDTPAGANRLNQTMLQKMAGSAEFSTPERDRNLPGEVYATKGQGAVHWFGVYGKSVYWLALAAPAGAASARPVLEAVWEGLATAPADGTLSAGPVPARGTGAAKPSSTTPVPRATTAGVGAAIDAAVSTEQQVRRTNSTNAVEIDVLFLNAMGKEKPATLSFEVGFTTHSVNLSQYDLTRLASLKDKDGRTLQGLTWVSESDDPHHRAGVLKVPNVLDGGPFATAKSGSITLVLKDIADVPAREFTWVGEYLGPLGEGR